MPTQQSESYHSVAVPSVGYRTLKPRRLVSEASLSDSSAVVSGDLRWVQSAHESADPTWMGTSVQVMFLVIVVAVSTVLAFVLDVRRAIENDRFVEWLKTERKSDWDALTRSDRFLTIRAVEILRRGALADDAEFHTRYQLTRHGPRFAAAMSVAGAGIGLVILGTVLLGWNW